MEISTGMIKELREKTGAGILDCKKALQSTEGNVESAVDYLRKKGLASAAKKVGRVATEGKVHAYIHGEGRIGVLVEINCETDFVARTEAFQQFCQDIGLQIAAAAPTWVRREEVPGDALDRETSVLTEQARASGKPEKVIEKIVSGRIDKFYGENCLLEQAFIKNPDTTVQAMTNELIAKLGENIAVRRFSRFVLGEGLAKKEEDFAAEVAAQLQS